MWDSFEWCLALCGLVLIILAIVCVGVVIADAIEIFQENE